MRQSEDQDRSLRTIACESNPLTLQKWKQSSNKVRWLLQIHITLALERRLVCELLTQCHLLCYSPSNLNRLEFQIIYYFTCEGELKKWHKDQCGGKSVCLKFLSSDIWVLKAKRMTNKKKHRIRKRRDQMNWRVKAVIHYSFLYSFDQQTVVTDMLPGTEQDCEINYDCFWMQLSNLA